MCMLTAIIITGALTGMSESVDRGEIRAEIPLPSRWTSVVIISDNDVYHSLSIAFDRQESHAITTMIAFYDLDLLFKRKKRPGVIPIMLRNTQSCAFDYATRPLSVRCSSGLRIKYRFDGKHLKIVLPAAFFSEAGQMYLEMKRVE